MNRGGMRYKHDNLACLGRCLSEARCEPWEKIEREREERAEQAVRERHPEDVRFTVAEDER